MRYCFGVLVTAVCLSICIAAADQWDTTDVQRIIASGSILTGNAQLSKNLVITPTNILKTVNGYVTISDTTNVQAEISSLTTYYDNNHKYTQGIDFIQTLNIPVSSPVLMDQNYNLNWDKTNLNAAQTKVKSLLVIPETKAGPAAIGFDSGAPEDFLKEMMLELGASYGSGFYGAANLNWQKSDSSEGITCVWGQKTLAQGQG